MKLQIKNKKFFKELQNLYKQKTKNNAVSPAPAGPEFIDICFDDDFCSESHDQSATQSPQRKIGKLSHRQAKHAIVNKCKNDASRCYKVLGLKTYPNSNKVKLIDTLSGKVYNTSMPNLTKNACAYESRLEALSERLPSRLVGAQTSERLCRVLVSFECWGETHRRLGGGNGCSQFEFLRFMKVEESLDSPAHHSLKASEQPTPPHFYPKRCNSNSNSSNNNNNSSSRGSSKSKSTLRRGVKRCVSSVGPNPSFRTATTTKDARLQVQFSY